MSPLNAHVHNNHYTHVIVKEPCISYRTEAVIASSSLSLFPCSPPEVS